MVKQIRFFHHTCTDFPCRYTAAGVFSRCMLEQANNGMKHCCKDPVVFQKLNEEIKRWIWKTAPGVRESVGCPKKKNPSIYLQNIFVDYILYPYALTMHIR